MWNYTRRNSGIKNINFAKNTLEILNASTNKCGITQKGIEQLEILNASTNECGITQEGIEQLEILKDLYVSK